MDRRKRSRVSFSDEGGLVHEPPQSRPSTTPSLGSTPSAQTSALPSRMLLGTTSSLEDLLEEHRGPDPTTILESLETKLPTKSSMMIRSERQSQLELPEASVPDLGSQKDEEEDEGFTELPDITANKSMVASSVLSAGSTRRSSAAEALLFDDKSTGIPFAKTMSLRFPEAVEELPEDKGLLL